LSMSDTIYPSMINECQTLLPWQLLAFHFDLLHQNINDFFVLLNHLEPLLLISAA
jgi:hypothetical protein